LDGAAWVDLNEAHPGQALLLGPTASLRLLPRPGWSGSVGLTYHAWDLSSGQPGTLVNLSSRNAVGGGTAFSKAVATATMVVASAPPRILPMPASPPAALKVASPQGAAPPEGEPRTLPMRIIKPWEDTATVGDLVGDGLAVVRAVGQGSWQYSLDEGRTWVAFGPVYHGRALLLRASDRVRFLPHRDGAGEVVLTGRSWDGNNGCAGEKISLAARRSYGEGTPFGTGVWKRRWMLG
jgi:hypothetical protein